MKITSLVYGLASAHAALASPLRAALAKFADIVPFSQDEITINSVRTSGSGCPRRAVTIDISEDRTVVTLGFDEFQTFFGRRYGNSNTSRDKNCDIRLNLHYPSGYTFAVLDATYHGFAQLDSGVVGSVSSSYSFPDDRRTGRAGRSSATQTTIAGGGAYADGAVYTKHDVVPVAARVVGPCDGKNTTLLIRTRINLNSNNDSASGTLTGDDASIALTQQVHFGWAACDPSATG
ncbi:hypothetical protein B0T26DRAFT_632170 [Lasiosphaeria miniovina]|uniref:Secreted protein n=1 Tax=Lasiosphaeria miniovina TaxID=1954250 RepID=A0AA40BI30_9PEZI|nr:uncharacterized protein B0T26DRAFT_632170 [Lasiosphaeria miniovina]KAK0734642.1 hypothetical protein B0T26DRAFT_632170 [Lasiosphaeria miniovina]